MQHGLDHGVHCNHPIALPTNITLGPTLLGSSILTGWVTVGKTHELLHHPAPTIVACMGCVSSAIFELPDGIEANKVLAI